MDGLAKLSARQIAQAANPPGLAPQRGTLQAFEHPRSKSCGAANPDRPGICGRRPWRGRSKACGERRQKKWTDKIWARRYQAIVISDEEAAQTSRLEYLLANGVKEGLVERVRDWPGVHCVRNLLAGEPLEGLWFDRTKEYSARNRGKTISPGQFATTETVTLSPLPCWEHLSPEQLRSRVEAIVQRIEETAARGREESGSAVAHYRDYSPCPSSKEATCSTNCSAPAIQG